MLLAAPDQTYPFLKVAELTLTGPDEARVSQAGAFHSFGEPARLVRGKSGKVKALRVAGGLSLPEAALAKELTTRYDAPRKASKRKRK